MFFLILLFFLFSPYSIFAAPGLEVSIQSAPNKSNIGQTFPVIFNIKNIGESNSFYYKFIGGTDTSTSQIQTFNNENYYSESSSWSNFNSISIDTGTSATITGFARVCPDCPSGQYNLKIRVASTSNTSGLWSTSPITSFTVPSNCTYDYSSWGNCSSSSVQTRVVNSSSPSDCIGTPILSQPCTYTPPISTPINTPTTDPTEVNPDGKDDVYLVEYMPYLDPEWIEIYNKKNHPVKLIGWKIEDSKGNSESFDLNIGSSSYGIYELKKIIFDNNNEDKVILRNHKNEIISETFYNNGLLTKDKSWSNINGNWCQSSITKGYENVTSCYTAATSTPTYSPTPTIDKSKYVPDELATASAIVEPTTEPNFLSPTPTSKPTPTSIDGLVLGDSTSLPSSKKNYFPLILIVSGGLLLISPVIISKIKFKK